MMVITPATARSGPPNGVPARIGHAEDAGGARERQSGIRAFCRPCPARSAPPSWRGISRCRDRRAGPCSGAPGRTPLLVLVLGQTPKASSRNRSSGRTGNFNFDMPATIHDRAIRSEISRQATTPHVTVISCGDRTTSGAIFQTLLRFSAIRSDSGRQDNPRAGGICRAASSSEAVAANLYMFLAT